VLSSESEPIRLWADMSAVLPTPGLPQMKPCRALRVNLIMIDEARASSSS